MAASSDVLVPKSNGLIHYEGRRVVLRAGVTTVRAGHPILSGREHLFEPLTVMFDTGEDRPRRGRPPKVRTAVDHADEQPVERED